LWDDDLTVLALDTLHCLHLDGVAQTQSHTRRKRNGQT
jgi:hypothetical protein